MSADGHVPTPPPVSDHCDGRIFFNLDRATVPNWAKVLRWKITSRPAPWPRHIAITPQKPPATPTDGTIAATWINHATFLLQTSLGNLITDPVYSQRCGPGGFAGPPRVHEPGIAFADLPHIDIVLLSHDHYDHCDLATLRRIARVHSPLAITPLRNRDLLLRAGFTRIVELDWWQSHATESGIKVTVTPAQHWSNRLTGLRFGRLWGGFSLEVAGRRVFFSGDTGYHPELFKNIGQRLGPPDLAMLPIGAYTPRWFMRNQHCDPAEAVQIHRDLGARQSVAMHWGTFQLTDEGREEPVNELAASLAKAAIPAERFKVLQPGEGIIF